MADRPGMQAPSSTRRPRRITWEEPSVPESSPFTFSSPADPWIPYNEVLRTFHLRDNVHGMFGGAQETDPPPPYESDQASLRTYRNFKPDWIEENEDDDPWDATPEPRTPRAKEFEYSDHSMPRDTNNNDDDGWQKGGPSTWPAERPSSRPPSPRPFPPELPDEMDFLRAFPDGKASIKYTKDDGSKDEITGLDKSAMIKRCELLEHVFECEARRTLHVYLEILTERSALPFIRYLHTGAYARNRKATQKVYDEPPTPLLVHIELFRLARHFDLPSLAKQVRGNLHIQTEFCCSHPEKPIGLVASIRFIYEHANDFGEDYDDVLDIIVNYCVGCFRDNRLSEDSGFKELILENNDLYHRMYKNSLARDDAQNALHYPPGGLLLGEHHPTFPVSVTAEIVQLSFEPSGQKTPTPRQINSVEMSASPQSPSHQLEGLKSILLSRRKRRAEKQVVKEEDSTDSEALTASEAEDGFDLIRKRSKAEDPYQFVYETDSGSVISGASVFSDSGRPSDSEYDVVPGPSRVIAHSSVEPSDTESDWEQLPRPLVRELPIRSTGSAPVRVDHDDADQSESDWEQVSEAERQ